MCLIGLLGVGGGGSGVGGGGGITNLISGIL